MFEGRSTTKSWVMVFSVKSSDGVEKIVHISHCGRLFKLAAFIFYIYKEDYYNSNFEFYYLEDNSRSYRGYTSFRLKTEETSLPKGVGNMRHERLDSAFFSDSQQIGLRVEGSSRKYVVKIPGHSSSS